MPTPAKPRTIPKTKPEIPQPWHAFQVRQRDMEAKRAAVLRTAAHLFLESGYRRTSMSQLATRLNVTKPSLYYYFRSKEEILVECYRLGIATIYGLLDEADLLRGSGLDKVRAQIMAFAMATVTTEFGRCVAMLDDKELSPGARREVRALKRRIDTSLQGFLNEGVADGSIAPCNVKLAAFAVAGAINWIGTWYQPEGDWEPAEIAAEMSRLLTFGLSPAATQARGSNSRTKEKVA